MRHIKLGDLANFNMGQSPLSSSVSDVEEGLPFLQGNAEFGSITPNHHLYCTRPIKLCKSGDILISVRAPVGALNKADQIYCIGRGLAAISFVEALPNFGWHLLNYWVKDLHIVAQGSTFEAISKSDLENLWVMCPSDQEQYLIAQILDTLDNQVRETERLIAKLKEVRVGLLHDLFTKGIDEHGEVRDPVAHTEQFNKTALGLLPKEWNIEKFEELADVIDPQPDHRAPPEISGGEPYIGVGDFQEDGSIDFKACRKVSPRVFMRQQERFHIVEGDILFGKIGTIGLPQALPQSFGYALSANTVLIKPRNQLSYVLWLLHSSFVERHIQIQIHSTSQSAFGIQRIRAMPVPQPSKDEQRRIATILDYHQTRISSEEAHLRKLQQMKKGLIHDLLTGVMHVSSLLALSEQKE